MARAPAEAAGEQRAESARSEDGEDESDADGSDTGSDSESDSDESLTRTRRMRKSVLVATCPMWTPGSAGAHPAASVVCSSFSAMTASSAWRHCTWTDCAHSHASARTPTFVGRLVNQLQALLTISSLTYDYDFPCENSLIFLKLDSNVNYNGICL